MNKFKILTLAIFTLLSITTLGVALVAKAEIVTTWTQGMFTVVSSEQINTTGVATLDRCIEQFTGTSLSMSAATNDPNITTDCLIGKYGGVEVLSSNSYATLFVRFPGDSIAYKTDFSCWSCVYLPSRDTLVAAETSGEDDSMSGRLAFYGNFTKRLHLVNAPNKADRYVAVNLSSPDRLISNFAGSPGRTGDVYRVHRSANDRWLVIEFSGKGLFRLDLNTMQMVKFSDWSVGDGNDIPFGVDITNDGSSIAVFGTFAPGVIVEIVSGCGISLSVNSLESDLEEWIENACPTMQVTDPPGGSGGSQHPTAGLVVAFQPDFNDIGDELTFVGIIVDGTISVSRFTIRADSYDPSKQLDYLALGDSYSSGEGDTIINPVSNQKYYRPWTDVEENKSAGQPREKCHISTRSYPYRLAASMNLAKDNPKQWDTVACSGAKAWDVNSWFSSSYLGQEKGKSKLYSKDGEDGRLDGYNADALKAQALNEFIPGRQKQIEFVKIHRPKAITLTMGGNDIDFGGKITNCIMTAITGCDIATKQGREELGREIQGQFNDLRMLYEELRRASPATKIYVLGYSQVINGKNGSLNCLGDSIGGLDDSERRVIEEGYSYLNDVIEAAAKYAGVKYIDVEYALGGHRLCSGAFGVRYATGISFASDSERQESFHPNSLGSFMIASTVNQRLNEGGGTSYNLLTYPYTQKPNYSIEAPNPTSYLAFDTNDNKKVRTTQMTSNSATKGSWFSVFLDTYHFAVDSIASIKLHSDPIDLGDHTVNSDGSLSVQLTIPETVPAGYHTLIVTGETYTGEPIQYEQVIFVHGSNLDDIDEDGINDDVDKCLFITPRNEDRDADGIDDACDLEMGEIKEPYRIRAGDLSKIYNNAPESTDRLYIERNVSAATLTGVGGDYDQDGDGWVVVAVSSNGGSYARFWTDGENGHKLPHISFRTAEKGCVQYKPADLAVVAQQESAARMLVREAENTDTCRSEPSEADTDQDGQPDNTQPLYRARNGDPAKGESPSRLYLERSTRAAEAQLGISDYAPNKLDTPEPISPTDTKDYRQDWSLLATSSKWFTAGTYERIHYTNSQPYVLANINSPLSNFCYAYKPQSLATIKQSTQTTRQLDLDYMQSLILQMQGGCNG